MCSCRPAGGVFAGLVWLSALLFAYFGADFMRKFGITVNFSSAVILAFILWFVAFAARMLFSVTVGSGIGGKYRILSSPVCDLLFCVYVPLGALFFVHLVWSSPQCFL